MRKHHRLTDTAELVIAQRRARNVHMVDDLASNEEAIRGPSIRGINDGRGLLDGAPCTPAVLAATARGEGVAQPLRGQRADGWTPALVAGGQTGTD